MDKHLYRLSRAYLVPLPMESCSRTITIRPGETTIGRDESNQIHIALGGISRSHARIRREKEHFVVTDLKSRNGTYINQKRIKNAILKDGDRLSFGKRSFLFSLENPDVPKIEDNLPPSSMDTVYISSDDLDTAEMLTSKAEAAARQFFTSHQKRDDSETGQAAEAYRRLCLLYNLSDDLKTAETTDEIIDRSIDYILQAIPSTERVVAMMSTVSSDKMEPRRIKYRDARPEEDTIPISRTLLNKALQEKLALIYSDIEADDDMNITDSIRLHSLKSIICVPINTGDTVIGALHLDTGDMLAPFNQRDMELVAAVTNEMALSIDNMRLHRSVVNNERMAAIGLTITNVAHNIKNILMMNQGAEELMDLSLTDIGDERALKSWKLVRQSMKLMADLAADMLNFAKAGRATFRKMDINTLIFRNRDLFKGNFSKKGIDIEMDLDPDLPEWVVDEPGLQNSILNLVGNAADALKDKEGGKIRIATLVTPEDQLVIQVSDNGAGIAQENLEKIFQLFFTTKGTHGTGFGLPMTRRFAESLGGAIKIDSKVDVGTTVSIILPKKQSTELPAA